ncbi:MAG: hypothetical protein LBN11_08200 [Tannerella sp.]|nr:hypothetical protein [Tannerella sp.]
MKRFILISGLGLIIGMFNINKSEAQLQVHVSVNIDVQPAWGPSGYNYAEYYYIPELNIYYDVIHQLFHFIDRGRWISTRFLPVTYSYYDFYSLYKVVINNVLDPWRYNRNHQRLYYSYCYNYAQIPIYCMNDHLYYRARNNYHGWVEPRYMPHNDGRPRSRDYAVHTQNGKISSNLRSSHANEALHNNPRSENTGSREISSMTNNRSATTRTTRPETSVSRSSANASRTSTSTATKRTSTSSPSNASTRSTSPSNVSTRNSSTSNVSTRSSSKNSSSSVSTGSSTRRASDSSVKSSSRDSKSTSSSNSRSGSSTRSERSKK